MTASSKRSFADQRTRAKAKRATQAKAEHLWETALPDHLAKSETAGAAEIADLARIAAALGRKAQADRSLSHVPKAAARVPNALRKDRVLKVKLKHQVPPQVNRVKAGVSVAVVAAEKAEDPEQVQAAEVVPMANHQVDRADRLRAHRSRRTQASLKFYKFLGCAPSG